MQRFNAVSFISAIRILQRLSGVLWAAKQPTKQPSLTDPVGPQARTSARKRAKELISNIEGLNLPVSLAAARRYSARLEDDANLVKWDEVARAVESIESRLTDELGAIKFFTLDPDRAKYFESLTPLFGQEVADKLPSAIPDIEDAGRCLALGQGTATVFHLMRVMEAGLKQLAKMLGIPYAPSWESYITQINNKIGEKHKRKGIRWKRDEPFFREVLGDLQAIKTAWRNPTMHIVRRYSADEAEEVFRAVRTSIQRLATHFPAPTNEGQQP